MREAQVGGRQLRPQLHWLLCPQLHSPLHLMCAGQLLALTSAKQLPRCRLLLLPIRLTTMRLPCPQARQEELARLRDSHRKDFDVRYHNWQREMVTHLREAQVEENALEESKRNLTASILALQPQPYSEGNRSSPPRATPQRRLRVPGS